MKGRGGPEADGELRAWRPALHADAGTVPIAHVLVARLRAGSSIQASAAAMGTPALQYVPTKDLLAASWAVATEARGSG
jgi:hypothetical protein